MLPGLLEVRLFICHWRAEALHFVTGSRFFQPLLGNCSGSDTSDDIRSNHTWIPDFSVISYDMISVVAKSMSPPTACSSQLLTNDMNKDSLENFQLEDISCSYIALLESLQLYSRLNELWQPMNSVPCTTHHFDISLKRSIPVSDRLESWYHFELPESWRTSGLLQ